MVSIEVHFLNEAVDVIDALADVNQMRMNLSKRQSLPPEELACEQVPSSIRQRTGRL